MRRIFLPLFIFLFFAGTLFFHQYAAVILTFVRDMGPLAPVLFVGLYIVATLFFLPTMVLTFAGGALFGPFFGTLINLFGACTGATLAFCISRYKLAEALPARQDGKVQQVIDGMDRYGWYFLALVRTLPLIPFNLVNYGMGLTRMPLRTYILVTLIFLTPAEIFYTWCGYAGRQALLVTDIWINPLVLLAGGSMLLVAVLFKWSGFLQRRKQFGKH